MNKKMLKLLGLCLMISPLLASCGSDDDKEGDYTLQSLDETTWKGMERTYKDGELYWSEAVDLLFLSDGTGRSRSEDKDGRVDVDEFSYSLSGNLLTAGKTNSPEGQNPWMSGKWIVLKLTADSLVMTKASWFGEDFSCELRLGRVR